MKLLISAYACEPGFGSEPGVGWNWTMDLARNADEVHVITRSKERYIDASGKKRVRDSRANIEAKLSGNTLSEKITFYYFDLPSWLATLERSLIGDVINIYLWEICVFFFLLKRFKPNEFDRAQKVTIASHRFPSFIWYFAKEFVLGPIAGGERFPLRLLPSLSFWGGIKEFFRVVCQYPPLVDPFVNLTLYKADEVIAVTPETKSFMPAWVQKKCEVRQAVSTDNFQVDQMHEPRKMEISEELKLLYVGRIVEWKGIMLILKALKDIGSSFPVSLTIIGDGPDKHLFQEYAKHNELNVEFLGYISRQLLTNYYQNHDLFAFPSLRDSGGFVVLEAQAHGLPVLCLDLGGPAININREDGLVLSVKGKSVETVVKEIAQNVIAFASHLRNNNGAGKMGNLRLSHHDPIH